MIDQDISCLLDRTSINCFRTTLKRQANGEVEGLFYALRGGRKIDFGTVRYTESVYRCEGRMGSVKFRIASSGSTPHYDAPLVLLVPGISGRWASMVLLQATLLRAGFNVLYFDSRGIGENDHITPSFGYFEADDIVQMISYARDRSDYKAATKAVGLFGTCMGATTALRAALNESSVRVVVVEGTYYSAATATGVLNFKQADEAQRLQQLYPNGLSSVSPIDISRSFPLIPIRMTWGENDQLVSVHQRQELVRAYRCTASEIEYEYVESAGHMIQYGFPLTDNNIHSYMARIANFFRKHLLECSSVPYGQSKQM